MPMQFSAQEIIETIRMVQMENLDIRTITLGISLRDCAHPDLNVVAQKVYDKICRRASRLVPVGEEIERDYGVPIINKRISVTPIALVAESADADDYVAGGARHGSRGRRSGRQLHRRLLGARAQGHDGRRPGAAAVDSRGAGRRPSGSARRSTWARPGPASTWTPWRTWARSSATRRPGRPTATASAAPSWSCSATPWTTTRSWPEPFTASASRSAWSTSASAAPASSAWR
jgi:hypothetical protein